MVGQLIVFTILIRIILLPLNACQSEVLPRVQKIQPQINELRKKYPGHDAESRQLLSQETNKLYKEAGVNPYTGCLPLLIQLPVMYALYMAILANTTITKWTFFMDGFR